MMSIPRVWPLSATRINGHPGNSSRLHYIALIPHYILECEMAVETEYSKMEEAGSNRGDTRSHITPYKGLDNQEHEGKG